MKPKQTQLHDLPSAVGCSDDENLPSSLLQVQKTRQGKYAEVQQETIRLKDWDMRTGGKLRVNPTNYGCRAPP